MDPLWSDVNSWYDLIQLHLDWLSGKISGEHPSGYSLEDLDTTSEWTKLLKSVSSALNMLTMDSQMGNCDNEFTLVTGKFVDQLKRKHPEWDIQNNYYLYARESERSYIGGFIPTSEVNTLLNIAKRCGLIILASDPDGSFYSNINIDHRTRFNLTKVEVQLHASDEKEEILTDYMTNVTDIYPELNRDLQFYNESMQEETTYYISYITITTKDYCSYESFSNNIKSLINSAMSEQNSRGNRSSSCVIQ